MTSNDQRPAAPTAEQADVGWLIPPDLGRRVVETADEGIWVLDDAGATVFGNPKMAAILGYPVSELAALSVYDVLDEQGAAAASGNLARRRSGHVDELECNFVRKDGTRTWVLMHASPLHDDAGQYVGSLCMVDEINERRRTEELLLESKQQLADGQRVAHLGSWDWEPASKRTKWSEEMFHLFGIAGGVLQAETFFDSALVSHQVHADDRHKFRVGAEALEQGEPHFEHDARIIRPAGETVWIRWRGKAVRDSTGGIVRMLGTAHDVTATKRSEAALRTTSARYRLLQKMAFAANEASTLEEALQVAVDQICAHTGWPAGHAYVPSDRAVDGLAPVPIWHVDEPAWIQAFRTASMTMRDGESRGLAHRVLVGGKPAWTDLRTDRDVARLKVPLALGFQGAFAFPVLVGDDVACVLEFFARRPIDPDEAALEIIGQVGTQLSRVAERVATAADLAAARDAAMESSRLKSEFLATMSHEVRTPVNGIIGLTGLMLGTDLDSRQRQYAEGVKGAGESLLTIINDILDFSKIEAGKLDLEVIDFDLLDVVESAVELLAESARKKGLNLVATCHPDLPTALRGDPGRLGQILANLASNAVKFTQEGEVIVQAGLVDAGDISVVARFDVSDTGIGIAKEDMHRLFEPFSQVDASTTRIFGGTGLGLAISRQLVTAMGGELTVHSDVGRGTTFSFSLPLKRQPDSVGAIPKPTDQLLHGLPTLIVDDNTTNRMILFEQLTSWQMRPVAVDGGPAALDEMHRAADRGQPYELALVDMCMPDIDGLELARLISADEALNATSMVLLTSAPDIRAKVARRAGFVDMLTKPVRQSQLYDCLIHVVAPAGHTEPKPRPSPDARPHRGRVLVVEDNATNQMVATGILDQLRYRCDVAADGRQALDALAATDYSAILMDIQMPGMDGYEATGEIRRREGKARHTPIIAMTAHATPGDRDRCLAAGMDDYIAKPVRPRDVAAALTTWAQETETPPDRPDPEDTPAADPIDEDRLAVLRQVNPSDGSLLPRLIEAFLGDLPGTLDEIRSAVDDADDDALHRSVHRLKGAAFTLGATAVGAVCEQLEGVAAAGDHEAGELLDRLAIEIDRATEALGGIAGNPAV